MEDWVQLKHFPTYSVSSLGRVRHDRIGRYLKERTDRYGHVRVLLTAAHGQEWAYVKDLVASHFFRGYNHRMRVEHMDGNPANNAVRNLRPVDDSDWVTVPDAPGYEINVAGVIRRIRNKRPVRPDSSGCVTLIERDVVLHRSARKLQRELFGR